MPLRAALISRHRRAAHVARQKVDTRTTVVEASPAQAFAPIRRIGGATGWYFGTTLWSRARLARSAVRRRRHARGRRDPEHCAVKDVIDGWTVEAYEPDRRLRLSADLKLPGRGWLDFEVTPLDGGQRSMIRQTATFDPRGLLGRAYWYAILPIHGVMFRGMLDRIARQADQAVSVNRLPFDAVLVVAFGGPERHGRRQAVSRERASRTPCLARADSKRSSATTSTLAACRRSRHHDEAGARTRTAPGGAGVSLPVYVGMRNWHPLLPDTIRSDGRRRRAPRGRPDPRAASVVFQLHAIPRERHRRARAHAPAAGLPDVAVTYVGDWHTHPKFIERQPASRARGDRRLPEPARASARLVFTAHSVPARMPGAAALPAAAATNRPGSSRPLSAAHDWSCRVSEPKRPSRRSVARSGRL